MSIQSPANSNALLRANFSGLERVSADPKNKCAMYRLHKRSGTSYDFDVSFTTNKLETAVSARIKTSLGRLFKTNTDNRRSAGIVEQLNHPDWQKNHLVTCVVDVSADYKKDEPETISTWIERANLDVTEDNPALTLILDLDGTVFSKNKSENFDEFHSVQNGKYFNSEAMRQIGLFQKRGHKLKVLTDATYSYESIKSAFEKYSVKLEQKDYLNSKSNALLNLAKRQFLRTYSFNKSCLHVDDLMSSKSGNTHFHHVTDMNPFPELIKE